MRTCPSCGKDTRAGMTEACTNCGFSPGAPPDEASVGQIFGGGAGGGFEPAPTSSAPPKPGQIAKSIKPFTWLRIVAVLGFIGFGIFSNSWSDYEADTSLDRLNLEISIRSDAEQVGASVFVDCPESVESAETGDRFECRVENLSGDVTRLEVEARGSGFEYSTQPLIELKKGDRDAFGKFGG